MSKPSQRRTWGKGRDEDQRESVWESEEHRTRARKKFVEIYTVRMMTSFAFGIYAFVPIRALLMHDTLMAGCGLPQDSIRVDEKSCGGLDGDT